MGGSKFQISEIAVASTELASLFFKSSFHTIKAYFYVGKDVDISGNMVLFLFKVGCYNIWPLRSNVGNGRALGSVAAARAIESKVKNWKARRKRSYDRRPRITRIYHRLVAGFSITWM